MRNALIDSLPDDLRCGVRAFARAPALHAVAVLSLAAGSVVCGIAFSVVDQLFLRTAPLIGISKPLAVFETTSLDCSSCLDNFSRQTLDSWRRADLRSVSVLSSYREEPLPADERGARFVNATHVDSAFFTVVGALPMLGRTLLPDDYDPVVPGAVTSYGFWKTQLGGRHAAVGSVISIGEARLRIVGIMPPGFRFPEGSQLWVAETRHLTPAVDRARDLLGLALLREGASIATARTELELYANRIAQHEVNTSSARGIALLSLEQAAGGRSGSPIWLVLAAALATFLAGCANLGNLFFVKALARSREFAIRAALGAPRRRLVQQLATEHVLIAVAGTTLGLALLRSVAPFAGAFVANAFQLRDVVVVDGRTIGALAILGAMTTLVMTGASLRLLRTTHLHLAHRGGLGRTVVGQRLRSRFVVAQVVGVFVLAMGASLMLRSYAETRRIDLGVDDRNVLVSPRTFDSTQVPAPGDVRTVANEILEQLQRTVGPDRAALWGFRWLDRSSRTAPVIAVDGRGDILARPDIDWPRPYPVGSFDVSPDAFAVLGMTLLEGRGFVEADRDGATPVAIVNERTARTLWPGRSAVGQRLKIGGASSGEPWLEVVGVVSNTAVLLEVGLGLQLVNHGRMPLLMFRPFDQAPSRRLYLAVRAEGASAVRGGRLDASLARVIPAESVTEPWVRFSDWQRDNDRVERVSATMHLLVGFAGAGILIALLGVYALISDAVRSRTFEIGIRVALGATNRDVARLIGRNVATVGVAAMGLGVSAALALSRLGSSILYGVGRGPESIRTGVLFGTEAGSPTHYVLASAIIGLVLLVAAAGPLRRAVHIPPTVAMRADE